jgi:hypothetical protein
MVPHTTDGSVFANPMVITLVNQEDCCFDILFGHFPTR